MTSGREFREKRAGIGKPNVLLQTYRVNSTFPENFPRNRRLTGANSISTDQQKTNYEGRRLMKRRTIIYIG
jgi:hypothetical protein